MDFASREDMALAALAALRHLPALLRAFEDGLRALGLEVLERSQFLDDAGNACPVLVARGSRLRFRLELRNAFEDFLAFAREARPVQVDPRLADHAYAREKVADVVAGRLEIVRALEESRDVAEAQRRLGELAGRFEWLRAVFEEEPEHEGDT